MSWVLYQKEIKANYKIVLLFLLIISMYASMIIAMYDPQTNSSLELMAKSMPQVFAAFGMMNVASTLLDFITNYLYGFILLVFPFVLSLILCHRLIGRYIDKGSMAYLLATPHRRQSIIMTQLLVLLTALVVVVAYTTLFIFLCVYMMNGSENFLTADFLRVNVGLLMLQCFLASFCYLSSILFNEARLSIGVASLLGTVFILIQMLSQISEQFEFLKYLTPMTLFDPQGLSQGDMTSMIGCGILLLSAVVLWTIGQVIFVKRDLPL